jgi:hypothetical protein
LKSETKRMPLKIFSSKKNSALNLMQSSMLLL